MPEAIGPAGATHGITPLAGRPARTSRPQAPGDGFTRMVGGLVEQVDRLQNEASDAIVKFAEGDGENLHEVMLAVNKAELSFKFLMEARNKLVEAYQEVMRMQL